MDKKVGIAVGVTKNLTKKYNAVELVKLGSFVIGGAGGGGRNDFAQAGGKETTKITESFNNIEVIKANASEDFEVNRFKKRINIFLTLL